MGKTDGGRVFVSLAASGIFPEDVSKFFGKRRKENLTDRLFSCKIRITVCTLSSGDRAFGSGPKGRRFESCRVQREVLSMTGLLFLSDFYQRKTLTTVVVSAYTA